MVCTGCCSCLDHIVTYLFKQLSRSTKKRTTPLNQESDRFLHIMQQHPEMIQQVRNMSIRRHCGVFYSGRPSLGERKGQARCRVLRLTRIMLPKWSLHLKITVDFEFAEQSSDRNNMKKSGSVWVVLPSVTPTPMPWTCPPSTAMTVAISGAQVSSTQL